MKVTDLLSIDKVVQNDKEISYLRDLSQLDTFCPREELHNRLMLFVVLSGNAEISVEGNPYHLGVGDIFICYPHHELSGRSCSDDLDIRIVSCLRSYLRGILKIEGLEWGYRQTMSDCERMHLSWDETHLQRHLCSLIESLLKSEPTPNRQIAIDSVIRAQVNVVYDLRRKYIDIMPPTEFSATADIMSRFTYLLKHTDTPFMSVNDYAAILNITPKHLSAVCRKTCGVSASKLITDEIIHKAQMLLLDTSLSVKQVSQNLGFRNVSHFGSFFRRNCDGISPLRYRKK